MSPSLIQKAGGTMRAWLCRLVGHDWFRRATCRVSWIGDNTGRLRQVTRCGRCPENAGACLLARSPLTIVDQY